MVDTWATVGSCAQIGRNVHLSGGVGIGGVLEPLQARPTIIEDDCFIGARSEVVEGVIVERGAVLSMGVFIGASTRIYDRESKAITYGRVPAGSVVVPGSLPAADGSHSLTAPSSSRESTRRRARRPPSTNCCGCNANAPPDPLARTTVAGPRASECSIERRGGARSSRAGSTDVASATISVESRDVRDPRTHEGIDSPTLGDAGRCGLPGRCSRSGSRRRDSRSSICASATSTTCGRSTAAARVRSCALPATPTSCRPARARSGSRIRSSPSCATACFTAAAPPT